MAARQRIMKGRQSARQSKTNAIMRILQFPDDYFKQAGNGSYHQTADQLSSTSSSSLLNAIPPPVPPRGGTALSTGHGTGNQQKTKKARKSNKNSKSSAGTSANADKIAVKDNEASSVAPQTVQQSAAPSTAEEHEEVSRVRTEKYNSTRLTGEEVSDCANGQVPMIGGKNVIVPRRPATFIESSNDAADSPPNVDQFAGYQSRETPEGSHAPQNQTLLSLAIASGQLDAPTESSESVIRSPEGTNNLSSPRPVDCEHTE